MSLGNSSKSTQETCYNARSTEPKVWNVSISKPPEITSFNNTVTTSVAGKQSGHGIPNTVSSKQTSTSSKTQQITKVFKVRTLNGQRVITSSVINTPSNTLSPSQPMRIRIPFPSRTSRPGLSTKLPGRLAFVRKISLPLPNVSMNKTSGIDVAKRAGLHMSTAVDQSSDTSTTTSSYLTSFRGQLVVMHPSNRQTIPTSGINIDNTTVENESNLKPCYVGNVLSGFSNHPKHIAASDSVIHSNVAQFDDTCNSEATELDEHSKLKIINSFSLSKPEALQDTSNSQVIPENFELKQNIENSLEVEPETTGNTQVKQDLENYLLRVKPDTLGETSIQQNSGQLPKVESESIPPNTESLPITSTVPILNSEAAYIESYNISTDSSPISSASNNPTPVYCVPNVNRILTHKHSVLPRSIFESIDMASTALEKTLKSNASHFSVKAQTNRYQAVKQCVEEMFLSDDNASHRSEVSNLGTISSHVTSLEKDGGNVQKVMSSDLDVVCVNSIPDQEVDGVCVNSNTNQEVGGVFVNSITDQEVDGLCDNSNTDQEVDSLMEACSELDIVNQHNAPQTLSDTESTEGRSEFGTTDELLLGRSPFRKTSESSTPGKNLKGMECDSTKEPVIKKQRSLTIAEFLKTIVIPRNKTKDGSLKLTLAEVNRSETESVSTNKSSDNDTIVVNDVQSQPVSHYFEKGNKCFKVIISEENDEDLFKNKQQQQVSNQSKVPVMISSNVLQALRQKCTSKDESSLNEDKQTNSQTPCVLPKEIVAKRKTISSDQERIFTPSDSCKPCSVVVNKIQDSRSYFRTTKWKNFANRCFVKQTVSRSGLRITDKSNGNGSLQANEIQSKKHRTVLDLLNRKLCKDTPRDMNNTLEGSNVKVTPQQSNLPFADQRPPCMGQAQSSNVTDGHVLRSTIETSPKTINTPIIQTIVPIQPITEPVPKPPTSKTVPMKCFIMNIRDKTYIAMAPVEDLPKIQSGQIDEDASSKIVIVREVTNSAQANSSERLDTVSTLQNAIKDGKITPDGITHQAGQRIASFETSKERLANAKNIPNYTTENINSSNNLKRKFTESAENVDSSCKQKKYFDIVASCSFNSGSCSISDTSSASEGDEYEESSPMSDQPLHDSDVIAISDDEI